MTKIKPSVIEQLETMEKTLAGLEQYEMDVSRNDLTDCIFYAKMKDRIHWQLIEIKGRDK